MAKYISGSAKKGNTTYYFVKDASTGMMDTNCTRYLKHKVRQNRADATVKRIACILPHYMNYLSDRNLTLKDVAALKFSEQSEHFLDFLMEVKNGAHTGSFVEVKNNTANSYLQAVFGLYDFLHRDGVLPYLKVLDDRNFSYTTSVGTTAYSSYKTFDGYLRPNKHTARTATKEQVASILAACSCSRDKLLILLMEETGLRIGEALGIRYTEDIDFQNKRIFVRYRTNNPNSAHAKNAEERYMKISDSTFALLNVYLAENASLFEKTDYLFIVLHGKTRGNPLSANSFYTCLETIGKKIGLKVTNHMLRHYFANSRRKAHWEIIDLSISMGHKSIKTTIDYLDEENEEVEQAQELFLKENEGTIPISDFL